MRPRNNVLPRRDRFAGSIGWLRRSHIQAAISVVVLGVTLSVTAFFVLINKQHELAERELSVAAQDKILTLQFGIDDYLDKVAALRAFFQSSSHDVSRKDFENFAALILGKQSAIQFFAWVPRVYNRERATVERAAVEDGIPNFQIRAVTPSGALSPSPERAEYYPLYYTTDAPSSSVQGIDLNSEPMRRRTIERARDGNELAASSVFMLHSGDGDRHGFFVVLPVYKSGAPLTTIEERRHNLIGFTEGIFQISVMIERILATSTVPTGFDFYFYDNATDQNAPPIYFHSSTLRSVPAAPRPRAALKTAPHWSGEIKAGDGRWTFVAVPIDGGPGAHSHVLSWIELSAGLTLSGLIAAYILMFGRNAQKTLEQSRRLDAALCNMIQGLLMFDSAERLIVCNDRYIEMYGLSREIVKPGCTFRDLLRHRIEIGHLKRDIDEYHDEALSELRLGNVARSIVKTADGREISIINRSTAGGGWISTHEDITEQRLAEAKISYMGHHDALTDLPNRALFRQQLENCIAHLGRDQKAAILYLDLDYFKRVNDTLGHPVGDKLLQQVSERLRGCVRDSDSVARLGGDEFAVLQSEITLPADVVTLAVRIIDAISSPFDLDGHQVSIGISIGIVIAPTDGADPDQLIKNADLALYRAKEEGRGAYRFFEQEMDARMQARSTLERELRSAVSNGEFELYYQPLVDLKDNHITSFEALLRWNHPTRGLVSPTEFIPVAEETTLIVPIGEWVLRQACKQAAKWPSDVGIAINLSAVQFKSPSLVQVIIQALAQSGLSPSRLHLEITESVLLANNASTLGMLHQLRGLGVRISMDDFGTGYSSLSYLRSFPFDKIKLDQSFLQNFTSENKESRAIIRAVGKLGNSLGMTTTAEGVETQAVADYLKNEGYKEIQGYLISKPVTAKDVAILLAKQSAEKKAVA